jgi:hypothetical protein
MPGGSVSGGDAVSASRICLTRSLTADSYSQEAAVLSPKQVMVKMGKKL